VVAARPAAAARDLPPSTTGCTGGPSPPRCMVAGGSITSRTTFLDSVLAGRRGGAGGRREDRVPLRASMGFPSRDSDGIYSGKLAEPLGASLGAALGERIATSSADRPAVPSLASVKITAEEPRPMPPPLPPTPQPQH
jgi:hypothetical protein